MSSEPFTHTPRPAIVPDSHPDQRYFGADSHTAAAAMAAGPQCRSAAVPQCRSAAPAGGGRFEDMDEIPFWGTEMTTEKIYNPWIKWHGGERPVPPGTSVEVKFRCGLIKQAAPTKDYYWHHHDNSGDIVEYRTVTKQADLDAAEKLLRANRYTVTPPAKPLTFEDDLRHQPPLMTATEINALPHKAREYIHQLEANTDPSGMVRKNMQLLDTNKGLQIMYRNRTDELDRVKQAMEPLTFEDVVPMTEAPPKGTWYWVPQPFRSRGVEAFAWDGAVYDLAALRHRMAYLEREHALIAARHIFGLKGGEL